MQNLQKAKVTIIKKDGVLQKSLSKPDDFNQNLN